MILVTGGAGFIGQHLVKRLMDMDQEVVIYDNLDSQAHPNTNAAKYAASNFVFGDVRNKAPLEVLFNEYNPHTVIHLASQIGAGQSMYEISNYVDQNVTGTGVLAEVAAKHGVRKFVLASSRAVYGEGPYFCQGCYQFSIPAPRTPNDFKSKTWDIKCKNCNNVLQLLPMDEDCVNRPTSVYGQTKVAQEDIFSVVGNAYDIPTTILRLFNVYGPGQNINNKYTGIVSMFTNWALSGKPINVYEDGLMVRDFVYIDDVVSAFVLAIDERRPLGIYNVGTGIPVKMYAMANLIKGIASSNSEIQRTEQYRIGDARHAYAFTGRAENVLEFKSTVHEYDGVTRLVEWAKNQPLYEVDEDKKLVDMGLSR